MTTEMRVKNRARALVALLVGGVAILPGVAPMPAAAQDSGAPITVETQVNPEIGIAELRVQGDEIHLTLEEAVGLALSRNLNLRTQRYAREQARLGIMEATGIYDFNLLAAISTSKSENPAASNLDGSGRSATKPV